MKSGERPIMPHVVRAQRSIIAPRRSSSCLVRGITKDRPTRARLVGDTYVISSRSAGSCCRSYSDAMARTPLARPGCVVTSLTRSPRSQISRSWSCRPLMYSAPVRAGMATPYATGLRYSRNPQGCRVTGGCALGGGRRRLRERHADRRVGFEGAPESELFANLPERGQHFLTEEADTRLRVRGRDEPIRRPESEDGRPRLLEQAPELRDHRLRRPRDDHLALDLVLEGRAAGIGPAPDRVLDEGRANRGREVARRGRPDRVREARELALHPHELAGGLHGLLLGLGGVAAPEVAAVLGAARVARLRRDLIVELPDPLGRLDGGAQRGVGGALLRRPPDPLLAEHARDPDPRVRPLQPHRPRVPHAVLVVRALPPERPRLRPRPDDQLVRPLEALAVGRGGDAGGGLLLTAAPHGPRHPTA